jgi:hypothetical protein
MKQRTLLADRLYFGLHPLRLRAATGRALARVIGLAPERARVSATNLRHDFALDTREGERLVSDFVAGGLLEPPTERYPGYGLTQEFAELAGARVVDPLPRARAKQILVESCLLAERINDEEVNNPVAIAALAVCGEYMTRKHFLDELWLGVLVEPRPPSRTRIRIGRMLSKPEGAEAIRVAFRGLSSFIRPRLVTDLRTLPRPFSTVFRPRV